MKCKVFFYLDIINLCALIVRNNCTLIYTFTTLTKAPALAVCSSNYCETNLYRV